MKGNKDNLLPCPFCGSIPEIPLRASVMTVPIKPFKEYEKYGFKKDDFGLTASIHCPKNCIFVLGKNNKSTDRLAVKEAMRVWNTRV